MSLLANSPIINDASGRLGNEVWARNRYGLFARALGNPNPSPPTTEQLAMRQSMADCVLHYKTVLSSAQREAWRQHGIRFPRPSRLGVLRPIDALSQFTRFNVLRRQIVNWLGAGAPYTTYINDPAATDHLEPVVLDTLAMSSFTKLASVVDPTNPTIAAGGTVMVYASPALDPAITFYQSPMTLLCVLDSASSSLATTLPATVTSPQHLHVKLRTLAVDGRIAPADWHNVSGF